MRQVSEEFIRSIIQGTVPKPSALKLTLENVSEAGEVTLEFTINDAQDQVLIRVAKVTLVGSGSSVSLTNLDRAFEITIS